MVNKIKSVFEERKWKKKANSLLIAIRELEELYVELENDYERQKLEIKKLKKQIKELKDGK